MLWADWFPQWAHPDCPHPDDKQFRDEMGYICLDCGVLRWIG